MYNVSMRYFVIIFIMFLSFSVASQKNVDLRSEFGPLSDQGNMGFCSAFATADLLSFWLNNNAGFKESKNKDTCLEPNMVSGLGTAISFNNYRRFYVNPYLFEAKKMITEAGSPQKALNQLDTKIKGLENVIESKYDFYDQIISRQKGVKTSPADVATKTYLIQTTEEIYRELWAAQGLKSFIGDFAISGTTMEHETIPFHVPDRICFNKDVAMTKRDPKAEYCDLRLQIRDFFTDLDRLRIDGRDKEFVLGKAKKIFPNVRAKYTNKMIKKLLKEPDNDVLKKLTNKSCKELGSLVKKTYPKPIEFPLKEDKSNIEELFSVIDKRLDAEQPVYIMYFAHFYYPYGEGIDYENLSIWDDSHSSSIVGRYHDFYFNEPVYIIRNTWGANACECLKESFIYTSPELINDTYTEFYANPVVNQKKDFSQVAIQLYESNKDKYKKEAPFDCDKGYFLVRKSVLAPVILKVSYYESTDKLPEKPKKVSPYILSSLAQSQPHNHRRGL